jgi:hypothetical protein
MQASSHPSAPQRQRRESDWLRALSFSSRRGYWLAAAGAAAAADAPFFVFCFFGFLTCFWVGGEYELTALPAGSGCLGERQQKYPAARERCSQNSVSFFIRDSP